jgi:hypothetical protein
MAARQQRKAVEWVSVRRAGEMIGKAPQTVHRMIADGELGSTKVHTETGNERTYVSLADVLAYREAHGLGVAA